VIFKFFPIQYWNMASFEKFMNTGDIFKNISVLSPHYVPKTLPFREKQMEEVMGVIAPALKGHKPRNMIIYGKTGTGKTCTMKRIMDEFEKVKTDANIHYLNCRIYNSRYRILQKFMKFYYKELEKSGFGLPFLYEKIIETLGRNHQMIVVLDEIDMVKDLDELVYTLTRANDEAEKGGITIIGISNKLSFKERLDPRSRSSLHEVELIFPPYTSEQLQKILEQRVDEGFQKDVIKPSAINLASAITAQESGDARYALKLLLHAGEIAEQHGKRLDEIENGFLMSGEVYDEYEKNCRELNKKSRSLRWYKEYLNDLEMLGLVTTTPSSKGIRGHTTLVKLGHTPEDVFEITKKNLFEQNT